jgi:hypothetical protein
MVQSIRVMIWRLGFPCDETPRASFTYPTSYSLGSAQGVLSPLMSNAFKFSLACVSGKEMRWAKGGLQKAEGLPPTSTHDDAGKSAMICGVTSRSADYVKT